MGTVLDGRYRIIKLIGEGGMGEVYSAEHVHIDKKFAIKLLKPEIVSNAEAVTRFRQEARSSSSIGHRNIIGIDDFGQLSDGRIYMCMELLNGAALNDMIQQPMSADRLLNILIQTGHGLAAAHAKGIVHRDMKPENIFVTIGPQRRGHPEDPRLRHREGQPATKAAITSRARARSSARRSTWRRSRRSAIPSTRAPTSTRWA